MNRIESLEDLRRARDEALKKRSAEIFGGKKQVIVGLGTAAIALGAQETLKAIKNFIQEECLSNVIIRQIGNFGLDSKEPVIQVVIEDKPVVTYGNVTPEIAREIMRKHIVDGVIHESHVIEI